MVARRAAVVLSWSALLVGSCTGSPVFAPAQLSSAEIVAAGSPELRTLDNTGFVYPGGQTTEVSQGLAPAVVGRGAYLVAPPVGAEGLLVLPFGSGRGADSSSTGGADRSESVARVARAVCDHEAYCERIGPSAAFESAEACSSEERARLGDVVTTPDCPVRTDLLAGCLRVIRAAPCIVGADTSSMPSPCDEAVLSCR